jgi:hypothetical protein
MNNLHQKYEFKGTEKLTGMHYCVEGRHQLVDDRNTYSVPVGTVGWLSQDGQTVVLEECANLAKCDGCAPEVAPAPTTVQVVELTLTPAPAEVALTALPAALPLPVAPNPVVFEPEKRHKFPIPCFPREKGWYGIGIPVVSCAALVFGGLGAAGFWGSAVTKLPGIPMGAGILP